jgi:hypothetical protein
MTGVKTEWDDPINGMGWDSEDKQWVGVTYDKYDLFGDLDITENADLLDDIVDAVEIYQWCQRDPYGLTPAERLIRGWNKFCEVIKHDSHFFPEIKKRTAYQDPDAISVTEVMETISTCIEELGLVRHLPVGFRVVRARSHPTGVFLRSAGELASPPKHLAHVPNRMSSPGIPMFYGALTRNTALAEIDYPQNHEAATVATFETLVAFPVVDLSKLPRVPSLFDLERNYLRAEINFLHDFVADLSKPIARDGRPHVEYVPTQYVTAHIQHRMRGHIKGIIYPSSRDPGGTSCVLFLSNEECREPAGAFPKPKQYLRLLPRSIRRYPSTAEAVGARSHFLA